MEAELMRKGWKKWHQLHGMVNIGLAFILLLLLLVLSTRVVLRVDLNKASLYALSPRSHALLDQLERPIDLTVLFQEEHTLFEDLNNLLQEYQSASQMIRINWVDPVKDPAKTEFLAVAYELREAQVLVLDDGEQQRFIRAAEMMDVEPVDGADRYRMVGFRGEQMISTAITELIEGSRPKIYFLQGHGELSLSRDSGRRSISELRSMLHRRAIDAVSLTIRGNISIPDDADAVVVAGPTQQLSVGAVEALERYLNRSGRLLILQDALRESGLEPMMRRWGIAVQSGIVMDPEKTLRGREVNVERFGEHPICRGLNSVVQLSLPSAILPASQRDAVEETDQYSVSPLLLSSDLSWLEVSVQSGVASFNEINGDLRGPLPMGLAIERGAEQGLDVEISSSRLVVLGDSDFISNNHLMGANGDFFIRCTEWLVDRDQVIDMAPRMVSEVRLPLTPVTMRNLFCWLVVGLPLLVLICGVIMGWRRRC
tara:strand:- start:2349 stop:3800 length:1452 start_codon:yes stop_codon:yes gene_type:complete